MSEGAQIVNHNSAADCSTALKFGVWVHFWHADISQLPKLCVKITVFMQGHVLVADWSVAHFVVIMNDVMNDNMAAFAHVGARLGAFFYWTRFLENNVPYHSNLSDQSTREISVRIRVRLRVVLF